MLLLVNKQWGEYHYNEQKLQIKIFCLMIKWNQMSCYHLRSVYLWYLELVSISRIITQNASALITIYGAEGTHLPQVVFFASIFLLQTSLESFKHRLMFKKNIEPLFYYYPQLTLCWSEEKWSIRIRLCIGSKYLIWLLFGICVLF